MSEPDQPSVPEPGSRPPGPPAGSYPPGPPPPGGYGGYGGYGGPPPPGAQGWGQDPRFAQPAAQPYVGGYHGPEWIPELGVQAASAGARIGAKSLDIVFFIVIQVALSFVGVFFLFASSSGMGDSFSSNTTFNNIAVESNLGLTVLLSAILLIVDFIYNVVITARFGGQPGKLILGLRIINGDGRPIDFRGAFIRWSPILALSLLSWVPILGLVAGLLRFVLLIANLVMVLSDERHRSVFDRVAGTYVIATR